MLLVCTTTYTRTPNRTGNAHITFVLPDAADSTPVYLSLYRNGLCREEPETLYTVHVLQNSCTFHMQLPAAICYFSVHRQTTLKGDRLYFFTDYLVQQNDNITITLLPHEHGENNNHIEFAYYASIQHLNKYTASFSGSGALKYSCRYQTDLLLLQAGGSMLSIDTNGIFNNRQHADTAFAAVHRYLQLHRHRLPTTIYYRMLANVTAMLECERLYFFQMSAAFWHHHPGFYPNAPGSYYALQKTKEKYCGSIAQKTTSPWYSRWKAMYYSYVHNNRYNARVYQPRLLIHTARQIRQLYKKQLADQIITLYTTASPKIIRPVYLQALVRNMKNRYCLQQMNRLIQTGAGFTAKNFQLTDTSGNMVSLKQFRGKTVFIDFWFIGCSACTQYYQQTLAPAEEKYRADSSVIFISINVDDRAQWLKEIDSGNYTTPHCVNLNTGKKGINHTVIKDYDVTIYPRPWLISKTGKIVTSSNSDLRFKGINGLIAFIEKAKALPQ